MYSFKNYLYFELGTHANNTTCLLKNFFKEADFSFFAKPYSN